MSTNVNEAVRFISSVRDIRRLTDNGKVSEFYDATKNGVTVNISDDYKGLFLHTDCSPEGFSNRPATVRGDRYFIKADGNPKTNIFFKYNNYFVSLLLERYDSLPFFGTLLSPKSEAYPDLLDVFDWNNSFTGRTNSNQCCTSCSGNIRKLEDEVSELRKAIREINERIGAFSIKQADPPKQPAKPIISEQSFEHNYATPTWGELHSGTGPIETMSYVNRVLEYCVKNRITPPQVNFRSFGPPHCPIFECSLEYDNIIVSANAQRKSDAKEAAYKKLYKIICE